MKNTKNNPFVSSFGGVAEYEEDVVNDSYEQLVTQEILKSDELPKVTMNNKGKRGGKQMVKAAFYCQQKLLDELKIYCVRHHTSVTSVIGGLVDTLLHGEK